MSIEQANESLQSGDQVDLFSIDLLPIGFNVQFYWTSSRQDGGSLWFGGIEYFIPDLFLSAALRSLVKMDPSNQPYLSLT